MRGDTYCTKPPVLDDDEIPGLIHVTCECGLDYFVAKR